MSRAGPELDNKYKHRNIPLVFSLFSVAYDILLVNSSLCSFGKTTMNYNKVKTIIYTNLNNFKSLLT